MVVYRIIPLAIFACLAVSGHAVPTLSNDLTIDEYKGTWFSQAWSSEHNGLTKKCSKTEVAKIGDDNESIQISLTNIYPKNVTIRHMPLDAKFINSVVHYGSENVDLSFTLSKFINDNQFIAHEEQPPYRYELLSRFPKAPKYVMEKFEQFLASINRNISYFRTDSCNYDEFPVLE